MAVGPTIKKPRFPSRQTLGLLIFVVIATVNFIWEEPLGPNFKTQLFMISLGAAFIRYLFTSVAISRRKQYALTIIIVLTLIPPTIRGLAFAFQTTFNDDYSYQMRIDRLMQRERKIYTNPYAPVVPDCLYGAVKRAVGREFRPGLYDYSHRFTRVDVTCFHLGKRGIKQWHCEGESYIGVGADFCFVFQGEADSLKAFQDNVRVINNMTGNTVNTVNEDELECGLGAFGWCAEFSLDQEDFAFTREICVSGALENREEGFIVDLCNFAHPPDTVLITFITDKSVHSKEVWRLSPERSFKRWLKAMPSFDCVPPKGMEEVDLGQTFRDSVYHVLKEGKHRYEDEVKLFRWHVPCRGIEDAFLLRYRIND